MSIITYFTTLYQEIPSDKWFEIRAIPQERGRAIPCFFPVSAKGFERGAEFCNRLGGEYHLYAGVLPRDSQSGNDCDVSASQWLWCDIDAGNGTLADVREKMVRIMQLLPTPQMIVDSGSGGGHFYWRLSEPVSLSDDDEQNAFRSLGKRIAQYLGHEGDGAHADISVVNPGRILRIPGTLNHKHKPGKMTHLILTHSTDTHDAEWWRKTLPYERKEEPVFQDARNDRKVFWGGISVGLEQWAQEGFPEGQRHRKLLGAAVWLKSLPDLSTDDARELFLKKVMASNRGAKSIIDRQEAEGLWKWR